MVRVVKIKWIRSLFIKIEKYCTSTELFFEISNKVQIYFVLQLQKLKISILDPYDDTTQKKSSPWIFFCKINCILLVYKLELNIARSKGVN